MSRSLFFFPFDLKKVVIIDALLLTIRKLNALPDCFVDVCTVHEAAPQRPQQGQGQGAQESGRLPLFLYFFLLLFIFLLLLIALFGSLLNTIVYNVIHLCLCAKVKFVFYSYKLLIHMYSKCIDQVSKSVYILVLCNRN